MASTPRGTTHVPSCLKRLHPGPPGRTCSTKRSSVAGNSGGVTNVPTTQIEVVMSAPQTNFMCPANGGTNATGSAASASCNHGQPVGSTLTTCTRPAALGPSEAQALLA